MELTVRKARLISGFTQNEIAESLGVHVNTYMRWEKSPEDMSIKAAKKFSRVVKIGFEDIFFDTESI
ncbi:hypothetical protein PMSD_11740 [Paenibacillus macquariensis subsp. defensor]|nr:hypothetical protein PMSD_11740 [Paenibacillus macquariensis subsp. defensor]